MTTRIPETVGSFRLTSRALIRGTASDSGFRFTDGSPTLLSVIVYDVPTESRVGADPQLWVAREGPAFGEVQKILQQRGDIAAYTVALSDTGRVATDAGALLEHRIVVPVRRPNGVVTVEMQFLYLVGDQFVKVRATVPQDGWEQSRAPAFARELVVRMLAGK